MVGMTPAKARGLVRKYSFLVGKEVTFRRRRFIVQRLDIEPNTDPARVKIFLINDTDRFKADFASFYEEWTGFAAD